MTHRNHIHRRADGFTLVELMIAMMFVAMLLLAIALVVIQIGGMYNKGVTMKAVNQAGRTVVADMKSTVSQSQIFNVSAAYQPQATSGTVRGGRFCTGNYTYVWNIGRQVTTNPDGSSDQINHYTDGDASIRFVKIRDTSGYYCTIDNGSYPAIPTPSSDTPSATDATEMFSDEALAVQSFNIKQLTSNTSSGMALYTVSMLISDADKGALDSVGNCTTPNVDTTYQNYCAVNEFDFTVQAGNRGGQ